jgi:PAS domain S-box-containing protein
MDDSANWILDDLPVGVWVGRAPDGQLAYSNRAFREILGMEAVAASRTGDVPVTYHVCDRAGNPYPVQGLPISRVLATGQSVVVDDMVIHRPDGRRVNIRAMANPVHDRQGRIAYVIVAFIDITREAAAEADRAAIEARLKNAVDHAPIAVWEIDREGIITLSEGAGLRALGVESGELVGRSLFEQYRDFPKIISDVRRALAGESFWYDSEVGPVVFDTWLTPIRDQEGQVVGARGVSRDISELRHLQAATIQDDRVRAMGALAASVAHEINNPLTYVLNYLESAELQVQELAEVLAGREPASEPGYYNNKLGDRPALADSLKRLQEHLLPVRKGVARIATITRDLKAFSRPDETRSESVDPGQVVQAVLNLMRKETEARARLELALQPTPPVIGNEARLIQVVMNLLLNAVQCLPDRDPRLNRVGVGVRAEAGSVLIEVADTGPGVPPADRQRIFEPFFTTKRPGQGTGLGLFVCRKIVRSLGGDVTVHDGPGGGALFRVTLPAAAPAEPTTPPPERSPGSGPLAGARLLVIDDDSLVAESLANQLRAAGHTVTVQTDGARALETVLAGSFDLVYCDLMMPGMTGMDIAAVLKARAPEHLQRVVFMTGAAFTPRAASFVADHASVCVEKPFDIAEETRRRLSARPSARL